MLREIRREGSSGMTMIAVLLIALVVTGFFFYSQAVVENGLGIATALAAFAVEMVFMAGFFMVNPNEARVLQLFGEYVGTVRTQGLRWANPFYSKRRISVRVRKFETAKLKVNDQNSNPIEIGAVVVWKVVDTAEAMFEVDDYEDFVHVQSEAALRNMATGYPYDAHEEGEVALATHTAKISHQLKSEVDERLTAAGVDVVETRISHLAYAPEIASAMLQRQQASAIIAARKKIVEGAVSMVEMALDELSKRKVVELDDERRAAMIGNLLVVLCGDQSTQPVVNTGSLYT